jgi:8-oxo-dGTP pyrophosphatase MutT (NUDIX family)
MVRWTVHGERSLYESEWLQLRLADVEYPDGDRFEHHLIRARRPAVGTVVHDRDRGVLLLWRHRFITDTWGWEIPAGRVEDGEELADAAGRETEEETGWRPGPLEPLFAYHPTNGLSDQTFHIFLAAGAAEVGAPTDATEAERVAWLTVPEVVALIQSGGVSDGLSLTALCWCLAFSRLAGPPPA